MRTVLWVALLFDLIALVLIAGAKLDKYQMSDFAFKQKLLELAPDQARLLKRLHKNLSEVRTQQMLEQTVLGAIAIGIFSHLVNPPVLGLLYSLGVFLIISLLIKIRFIEQIALRVFEGSLEVILSVVETTKPLLRAVQAKHRSFQILPGSQEEFMDQLRRLPSTILTPIQRQRLEDVLASEQKTTKDIMTPKKRVVFVEPSATLGPIVLSDLQKSGHGYFPVATKKGEPEGILNLGDIADLELAKQRTSVRELMSMNIAWVEEDASLFELAKAFLEEKQYIALVKNQEGECSGLVTIADLMKHLLGIVKE